MQDKHLSSVKSPNGYIKATDVISLFILVWNVGNCNHGARGHFSKAEKVQGSLHSLFVIRYVCNGSSCYYAGMVSVCP